MHDREWIFARVGGGEIVCDSTKVPPLTLDDVQSCDQVGATWKAAGGITVYLPICLIICLVIIHGNHAHPFYFISLHFFPGNENKIYRGILQSTADICSFWSQPVFIAFWHTILTGNTPIDKYLWCDGGS